MAFIDFLNLTLPTSQYFKNGISCCNWLGKSQNVSRWIIAVDNPLESSCMNKSNYKSS